MVCSRRSFTAILLDRGQNTAAQTKDSLLKMLIDNRSKDGTTRIQRNYSFEYLDDCKNALVAWIKDPIKKLIPDPLVVIS